MPRKDGKMEALVLGLGNPILRDDGVGLRVARELKGRLDPHEVTVMETHCAPSAISTQVSNRHLEYKLAELSLSRTCTRPYDW